MEVVKMVDVIFRFEKEGFITEERQHTIHEKGKLYPFLPTRIWFDSPFEIVVQDSEGQPVEGVSISIGETFLEETDVNGRISVTIKKEMID